MALIMGIQIIAILFALLMGYYAFTTYKRKQLKIGEFTFWIFVWLCFLLAAIFPTYLEMMAKTLSINRTMDFLTILGFFFVIMLLFYNYVQVRKNSQRLEEIVRKLAYRKAEKRKKR